MGPTARADLKREVEQATLAHIEAVGAGAFRKEPVIAQFRNAGVGKSSLYRWVDAVISSGRAGRHLADQVTAAVAEREARGAEPAAEAAAEVGARLPRVPTVETVAAAGGTIAVVEKLGRCIATAEKLLAESTAPDGSIRLKKMALQASEHLRRAIETGVKLAAEMRSISRVTEFNERVIAAISRLAPEVAEELRQDLHRLTVEWGC